MPRINPEEEINPQFQITSFIDVMSVLLCCFVTIANVSEAELQLGVQVPGETSSRAQTADTPIEITVQKDGMVLFNRSPVDSKTSEEMPELKERLKRTIERFSEQSVVIRPHADTRHDRVVAVLNACSYARVSKLTFGESGTK
jgi:biopolymer transport protein ExbD